MVRPTSLPTINYHLTTKENKHEQTTHIDTGARGDGRGGRGVSARGASGRDEVDGGGAEAPLDVQHRPEGFGDGVRGPEDRLERRRRGRRRETDRQRQRRRLGQPRAEPSAWRRDDHRDVGDPYRHEEMVAHHRRRPEQHPLHHDGVGQRHRHQQRPRGDRPRRLEVFRRQVPGAVHDQHEIPHLPQDPHKRRRLRDVPGREAQLLHRRT